MQIGGEKAVWVAHLHRAAATAVPARRDDRAAACDPHRRAHRGTVVHSVVGPVALEHRMEAAVAEPRRDPRIAQRRAQEELAQRPPLAVVVARRIAETVGLVRPAGVVVAQGEDRPDRLEGAVEKDLFVEDLEAVAEPQVPVEVQVPLQHLGHLVGHPGIAPGAPDGGFERSLQLPGRPPLPAAAHERPPRPGPPFVATQRRDPAAAGQREAELAHLLGLVQHRGIAVFGPQLAQIRVLGQRQRELPAGGRLQPQLVEHVAQRLAAPEALLGHHRGDRSAQRRVAGEEARGGRRIGDRGLMREAGAGRPLGAPGQQLQHATGDGQGDDHADPHRPRTISDQVADLPGLSRSAAPEGRRLMLAPRRASRTGRARGVRAALMH